MNTYFASLKFVIDRILAVSCSSVLALLGCASAVAQEVHTLPARSLELWMAETGRPQKSSTAESAARLAEWVGQIADGKQLRGFPTEVGHYAVYANRRSMLLFGPLATQTSPTLAEAESLLREGHEALLRIPARFSEATTGIIVFDPADPDFANSRATFESIRRKVSDRTVERSLLLKANETSARTAITDDQVRATWRARLEQLGFSTSELPLPLIYGTIVLPRDDLLKVAEMLTRALAGLPESGSGDWLVAGKTLEQQLLRLLPADGESHRQHFDRIRAAFEPVVAPKTTDEARSRLQWAGIWILHALSAQKESVPHDLVAGTIPKDGFEAFRAGLKNAMEDKAVAGQAAAKQAAKELRDEIQPGVTQANADLLPTDQITQTVRTIGITAGVVTAMLENSTGLLPELTDAEKKEWQQLLDKAGEKSGQFDGKSAGEADESGKTGEKLGDGSGDGGGFLPGDLKAFQFLARILAQYLGVEDLARQVLMVANMLCPELMRSVADSLTALEKQLASEDIRKLAGDANKLLDKLGPFINTLSGSLERLQQEGLGPILEMAAEKSLEKYGPKAVGDLAVALKVTDRKTVEKALSILSHMPAGLNVESALEGLKEEGIRMASARSIQELNGVLKPILGRDLPAQFGEALAGGDLEKASAELYSIATDAAARAAASQIGIREDVTRALLSPDTQDPTAILKTEGRRLALERLQKVAGLPKNLSENLVDVASGSRSWDEVKGAVVEEVSKQAVDGFVAAAALPAGSAETLRQVAEGSLPDLSTAAGRKVATALLLPPRVQAKLAQVQGLSEAVATGDFGKMQSAVTTEMQRRANEELERVGLDTKQLGGLVSGQITPSQLAGSLAKSEAGTQLLQRIGVPANVLQDPASYARSKLKDHPAAIAVYRLASGEWKFKEVDEWIAQEKGQLTPELRTAYDKIRMAPSQEARVPTYVRILSEIAGVPEQMIAAGLRGDRETVQEELTKWGSLQLATAVAEVIPSTASYLEHVRAGRLDAALQAALQENMLARTTGAPDLASFLSPQAITGAKAAFSIRTKLLLGHLPDAVDGVASLGAGGERNALLNQLVGLGLVPMEIAERLKGLKSTVADQRESSKVLQDQFARYVVEERKGAIPAEWGWSAELIASLTADGISRTELQSWAGQKLTGTNDPVDALYKALIEGRDESQWTKAATQLKEGIADLGELKGLPLKEGDASAREAWLARQLSQIALGPEVAADVRESFAKTIALQDGVKSLDEPAFKQLLAYMGGEKNIGWKSLAAHISPEAGTELAKALQRYAESKTPNSDELKKVTVQQLDPAVFRKKVAHLPAASQQAVLGVVAKVQSEAGLRRVSIKEQSLARLDQNVQRAASTAGKLRSADAKDPRIYFLEMQQEILTQLHKSAFFRERPDDLDWLVRVVDRFMRSLELALEGKIAQKRPTSKENQAEWDAVISKQVAGFWWGPALEAAQRRKETFVSKPWPAPQLDEWYAAVFMLAHIDGDLQMALALEGIGTDVAYAEIGKIVQTAWEKQSRYPRRFVDWGQIFEPILRQLNPMQRREIVRSHVKEMLREAGVIDPYRGKHLTIKELKPSESFR